MGREAGPRRDRLTRRGLERELRSRGRARTPEIESHLGLTRVGKGEIYNTPQGTDAFPMPEENGHPIEKGKKLSLPLRFTTRSNNEGTRKSDTLEGGTFGRNTKEKQRRTPSSRKPILERFLTSHSTEARHFRRGSPAPPRTIHRVRLSRTPLGKGVPLVRYEELTISALCNTQNAAVS